jgi:hypothetical protein
MTMEDNTALVRPLFETLNVGMEAVNALRRTAARLRGPRRLRRHALRGLPRYSVYA